MSLHIPKSLLQVGILAYLCTYLVATTLVAQPLASAPETSAARGVSGGASGSFPGFIAAVKGVAVALDEHGGRVRTMPLATSRPVFEAFGLSRDGQWLLYRPLANGLPSGELLLEEQGERARSVTTHVVLEAAWSPTDNNLVAFTYSTGPAIGLAVIDLRTGVERTLATGPLIADFLRWSDAGNGIFYYRDLGVDATFVPVLLYAPLSTSAQRSSEATPGGMPVLDGDALRHVLQAEKAPGRASTGVSFRVMAPGSTHEVLGDKVFGDSLLYASPVSGGTATRLGQGVLVATLQTGVVIRSVTGTGTQLSFVAWNGQETALTSTVTVDYKLPVSESIMHQGGSLYPAPGNCQIVAHRTTLGYAYDFVGDDSIPVWASAPGLVVKVLSIATCNTIKRYALTCPDYDPDGCLPPDPARYLGNHVLLEHADGTYTLYAHLEYDSVPVAVGATVCQGTVIARQGHTGSAGTGPQIPDSACGDHLHFQRQTTTNVAGGQSIATAFSDAPSYPLSCNTTYTSGVMPPSPYTLKTTSKIFGHSGGTAVIGITGSASCGTWTAQSLVAWVSVVGPAEGSGNGSATLLVEANTTDAMRTGTVIVAGQPVAIIQTEGPAITMAQRLDNRLVLRGYDFETSGTTVTINGQDVSDRIRRQSDTRIKLNGRNNVLNLVNGANQIVVTVNGKDSNVHILDLEIP